MSRPQAAMDRDRGAQQTATGLVGDPLKLPFARILQEAQQIRVSEAYRRMVTAGACALTGGRAEALYLDTIKGLSAHDLDVIVRAFHQLVVDMERRPFLDLLGPVRMEVMHRLDRQQNGAFYTPFCLNRLMADLLTAGDPRAMFTPGEILAANEPACGTSGMVLAVAEHLTNHGVTPLHMRWTVHDLSQTSCYASYINLTLWGVPATVVCGDTLRMTVNWAWQNVHWHQAKPWPTAEERRAHVAEVMRQERFLRVFQELFVGAA
ncbi:SAM-dependent DNA methyltransferase [Deinococcus sp. 6YEL10]|uniref:N-6 DNA methylase n=1 Tax=Deinococcus sp. 6YEL10 TaxID=2745870 RepID=UPI001E43AA08|nr:SAM-dependent DNA methyltransferase [Deinococcus sp. 6YEL10]